MSCKNLKAPQPPTLESLPSNINMPDGLSVDSVKNMASGKGLSDAMNNAQGMISSNLNGLKDKFSPDAIANKIGSTINSIADGITSRVTGAINGITSIGAKIKSFDPSSAAGSIKGKLQGQLKGASEFTNMASSFQSGKCAGSYVKQAGEFNKGISDSARSKVSGLSAGDKRKMVSDSNFRQAKTNEISEQVKSDTYNNAVSEANKEDTSSTSAQDSIASNTVDAVTKGTHKCGDWVNHFAYGSMIPINGLLAGSVVGYLQTQKFQKVGSFFGGYKDDVEDVLDVMDSVIEDYVNGLAAKYYFRDNFDMNPCGIKWQDVKEIDGPPIPGTGDKFKDGKDRNLLGFMMAHHPALWIDQRGRNAKTTRWNGPKFGWERWRDAFNLMFKESEWDQVYIRKINGVTTSFSNYNMIHKPTAYLFTNNRPELFDAQKGYDNFMKVIDKAKDHLYDQIRFNKEIIVRQLERAGRTNALNYINNYIDDPTKIVSRSFVNMVSTDESLVREVWSIATIDWMNPTVSKVEHLEGTAGKELSW